MRGESGLPFTETSHIQIPMLSATTKDNESIKRRCVLIKPNEEMEEVLVCLADKKAVKKIVGKEVEYKGEMQNQNIGILG